MSKIQRLLKMLKEKFSWDYKGSSQYEKSILVYASECNIYQVPASKIKPHKKLLKSLLYEFNADVYDYLGREVWNSFKDRGIVSSDDDVRIIYQPFGTRSFPDYLLIAKDRVHFWDNKIYNKNDSDKLLYLGETLEHPMGTYITFDQYNKKFNYFYGYQLNPDLESAYPLYLEWKRQNQIGKKQAKNSKLNQVATGAYGSFWDRGVRSNTEGFIPHRSPDIEKWETFVMETSSLPIAQFMNSLKNRITWGPLDEFVQKVGS